ncbi:IS4 family transposase [Laspinema sp. D1]|uniref:IS4 family transposase n=1 Tax=Laspinema palackyanum D2a TaxID=2953684 RepID=A0ABT2N092_9CYAN|nr:IS4 family transposase [Laspinema sp. D2a]
MINSTKPSENLSAISEKIKNLFDQDKLNRISKETGFIKRKSATLTPQDFLQLMTTELLKEPTLSYGGLCDCLETLNPEVSLTSQGLEERVNRTESVEYLRKIFEETLNLTIQPVYQNISSELLNPFPRIFLQDSTQFTLNEQLAPQFRGSGGSGSKAGCKLDVVYELKSEKITQIQISKATIPDQSRAQDFGHWIDENDLIIRDLGYFSLDALQECQNKKIYFLSRLLQCTDVYLKPDSLEPINLCHYANSHSSNNSVIEISAFIGKSARIPVRLIMYRLPQSIVSRRRQEAIKNAKKKGRTPSAEYLALLEFTLFITNVPDSIWSKEVVGTIYRIRWQIELRFKNWKSLLSIHILKGKKPERILCWLYGRLICLIIISELCSWANWYALESKKGEISLDLTIKWFNRSGRLAQAIQQNTLSRLMEDLKKNIHRLCKPKRTRKTTRSLIDSQIHYLDSFQGGPIPENF